MDWRGTTANAGIQLTTQRGMITSINCSSTTPARCEPAAARSASRATTASSGTSKGAADGLTHSHVRRLVETDHQGENRLWAVSPGAGLFYREHGRWQADPGNPPLAHGNFLALAQTHDLLGHERL